MVGYDFGDDLVVDIAHSNMFELVKGGGIVPLGNEGQKCCVEG